MMRTLLLVFAILAGTASAQYQVPRQHYPPTYYRYNMYRGNTFYVPYQPPIYRYWYVYDPYTGQYHYQYIVRRW